MTHIYTFLVLIATMLVGCGKGDLFSSARPDVGPTVCIYDDSISDYRCIPLRDAGLDGPVCFDMPDAISGDPACTCMQNVDAAGALAPGFICCCE